MYSSIAVNGTAADGYSSGDAIKAIQETAAQVLPKGYGYDFDGITREEAQTGSNTTIIFGICILLIYLILSALYESFLLPFAVILSVPCGLLGSFLFAKMLGLENNIYLQTGIIMLIGLLSKTAILITEYAADRRTRGHEPDASRRIGSQSPSAPDPDDRPHLRVRYDPAGALARVWAPTVTSTLGSGVVGGMIVGTLALLFLVPTLFIAFQTLQEKVKPIEFTTPIRSGPYRRNWKSVKTKTKRRNNKMKKLIIILAAAAMTGCGIYKPYTRPEGENRRAVRQRPRLPTRRRSATWAGKRCSPTPTCGRSSARGWRTIPTCNRRNGGSRKPRRRLSRRAWLTCRRSTSHLRAA